MATPLLLLSPDGSYDASGPITPTVAAGVATVAGEHGNAWEFEGVQGENVQHAYTNLFNGTAGTMIVRANVATTQTQTFAQIAHAGTNDLYFTSYTSSLLRFKVGTTGSLAQVSGGFAHDTWANYTVRWNNGIFWMTRDLTPIGLSSYSYTMFGDVSSTFSVGNTATTKTHPLTGQVESVMLFDAPLTDTELAEVQDIPWTWTMLDPPSAATIIRPQIIGFGSVL